MTKEQKTVKFYDDVFEYCPETGKVYSKIHTMHYRPGSVVGIPNKNGHLYTKVGRHYVTIHKVAWVLFHRKLPAGQIDHINGNPKDNRICNLRDVSAKVNAQNRRKARKDNTTGFLGVHRIGKGKYGAKITIDGKVVPLGVFSNPISAHRVYLQAKRKYHEGCTI